MLTLRPIRMNEDRTKAVYASDDCQLLLKMWADYYPKIGFNLPWVGYFIMKDREVIGTGAFNGKPVNNRVEISYWTFKKFEGQGVASFACRELIAMAKKADPQVIIFAKTAPEHNASTKVLERNNFVFSGVVEDHEIGKAWEWTYKEPK